MKKIVKEILNKLTNFYLILIVIFLIIYISYGLFEIGMDDSDKNGWIRSNFKIRTDYKTGLQYLESRKGFLIPRMNNDGKQITIEVK